MENFQSCIRLSAQTFYLESIVIFSLCSELIVLHYRNIVNHLDRLNRNKNNELNRGELLLIMKCLRNIEEANRALNRGFSFTLMSASCLTFMVVLTSSYTAVDYLLDNKPVGLFFWEASDVVDYFLGFALVCYMADRTHSSGININRI